MKVRDFATHLASHHTEMAKAHQAAMKEREENSPEHDFHKAAMESHTTMGEHCVEACKVLSAQKAMMGGGEDELEPIEISAVTPDVPCGTLVPRHGMRAIDKAHAPYPDIVTKLLTVD
jgi:hypothetical protein